MTKTRAADPRQRRIGISLLVTSFSLFAVGAVAASGCNSSSSSSVGVSPAGPLDSTGTDDGGCPPDSFCLDTDSGVIGPPLGPNQSPITPTFGTIVTASVPPPPISGGTLLVTSDGTHAVASDPDRDSIYVVDLPAQTVAVTIPLSAGGAPLGVSGAARRGLGFVDGPRVGGLRHGRADRLPGWGRRGNRRVDGRA